MRYLSQNIVLDPRSSWKPLALDNMRVADTDEDAINLNENALRIKDGYLEFATLYISKGFHPDFLLPAFLSCSTKRNIELGFFKDSEEMIVNLLAEQKKIDDKRI